jgi:hypothetical protein
VDGDVVGRIRGKVCELRSRDLKRGVKFRQMRGTAFAVGKSALSFVFIDPLHVSTTSPAGYEEENHGSCVETKLEVSSQSRL